MKALFCLVGLAMLSASPAGWAEGPGSRIGASPGVPRFGGPQTIDETSVCNQPQMQERERCLREQRAARQLEPLRRNANGAQDPRLPERSPDPAPAAPSRQPAASP